jgi:hypothetical protein
MKPASRHKQYRKFVHLGLAGAVAGAMGIATSPAIAQTQTASSAEEAPTTRTATPETYSVDLTLSELPLPSTAVEWSSGISPIPESIPPESIPAEVAQDSIDWESLEAIAEPTPAPDALEASPAVSIESVYSIPQTQSESEVLDSTIVQNASEITPSSSEFRILTPAAETLLDVPATTVILQFPIGSEVELRVNEAMVDAELIGRTETDPNTNLVTQTWYGVSLEDGENTITAQITLNGVAETTSVRVVVRGTPTQLTVETVEPRIPADGRSTATIRGELVDENGNRSNRDALVTLEASAGEFAGIDADLAQPGFQVQAVQGEYTASLRSNLEAQVVRLRATTNDLEAFTQFEFETALRTSLVTGVIDLRLGARGTNYYGSFREFLPADEDNATELDFRGAVFATGSIGEWLFTGAFNSDRPLNEDCDGNNTLFRAEGSCDRNYPVYGDDSTVDVTAPSTDNLFLRFERTSPISGAGSDFVMWGDYSIEEFATRSQFYTATSRQLHGFKLNYNLGDLRITGFYGNNVEGFQRDTLAPDGTSGLYFLSRRLLVPGSEDVFIELEEFGRPGTVLERQRLVRGADYEIDYDRGTLQFRQPILRTDIDDQGRTLVRRIVSTYQYESEGTDTDIIGGRVQYNLSRELNRESWVGATYLNEDQGNRDFELYGADAYISFGRDAHLIAEYAHSSNDSEFQGAVEGSAYRLDLEGTIFDNVYGHAYFNHTDAGFSNDATTSFVPGQTRYGAELQARLSSETTLRAQYDHEENDGIAPRILTNFDDLINPGAIAVPGSRVDNSLTTISAGIQQQIGDASLSVDWIHRDRQDRITDLNETSDQLRSRLVVPLAEDLTFRAQNETTLSGSDPIYPNRTLVGLDWQVYPGITVSLNQQFFSGGQYEANSITSLDINGTHNLGENTTLNGRLSWINAQELAGAVGIQHGITIAPGLRATFAYEHIFRSIFSATAAGTQFAQPYAVGQSASALGLQGGDSFSVGLDYIDNPNFQARASFEHRSSSSGSNTVISASALGRITPSLTALVSYDRASASNQTLEALGNTVNLRIGLAYRNPDSDEFNALLRYDYRRNPSTTPDSILFGSGTGSTDHVFSAEAIYAPDWRWEFYGKLAMRHSTSYLADDLVGTSTVTLAQLRATYRLGYRWDVVGEARWIGQPSASYSELGLVIEAGYYLTPDLRLSAGYAFGNISDDDFNGSRSAGGPYIGLTVKLNNLFEDFGLQDVAPSQQQESEVDPIANDADDSEVLSNSDDSSDDSSDTPLAADSADSTIPLVQETTSAPDQI